MLGELLPYATQGAVALDERAKTEAAPTPGDSAVVIDAQPIDVDFSMFSTPGGPWIMSKRADT